MPIAVQIRLIITLSYIFTVKHPVNWPYPSNLPDSELFCFQRLKSRYHGDDYDQRYESMRETNQFEPLDEDFNGNNKGNN